MFSVETILKIIGFGVKVGAHKRIELNDVENILISPKKISNIFNGQLHRVIQVHSP